MKLIITEKDNAARRIAEILSDGSAEVERHNGVNVYRWGDKRVVGLSGHVVGLDFPEEYANWRDVQPAELIDAEIVTEPTQENIVTTLEALARQADEAVIATDYDREGELIGKEAYELVDEYIDGPIQRVRFSSITDGEVTKAFADPDELDFDLAAAGEARQIIDLIWGAALTRFLSLSARQLGDDFISVGRVQSPTLKLIVDREREIQAFDPETYWELFADLAKNGDSFEAQYFYEDDDGTEAERVWSESAAQAVDKELRSADSAVVDSVSRRTRTDNPPEPFNTTAFIGAAGSLGYSAQRAMSLAEELYTDGYTTYPRTDNTVYPEDLEPDELLDEFTGSAQFGDDAERLLAAEEIEPTRGDEETTDHPPIHPTGELPARSDLSDDEWEIYELIVRRFFATVAESATWEHLRVVAGVGDSQLKANGKRLVEEGYHAVYPYSSTSENHVPDVEEGEELAITEVRLDEKETQPPRRYGQSRLIQKMEEMGIGTKCLTADTPVLRRDEDGKMVRTPVAELFESENRVVADGDTDIAVAGTDTTTVSFDELNRRTVEREQTLVSKRELDPDERVIEFTTRNGTFSVTEDHPLYVHAADEIEVKPAKEISTGDELLTTRRSVHRGKSDKIALSWNEFANDCDKSSKLYGTDCDEEIAQHRTEASITQSELGEQLGIDRSAISDYENGRRDVPVWILGELGVRPEELHGLNYETTIDNPFPLRWSPELARVVGNLHGDGSIHRNEQENTVDIRYHNTDRRLVDRFVSDIETLFGTTPTVSERPGRKTHHKSKYQVHLSAAVGRILWRVLGAITKAGYPEIPDSLEPAFIGAMFDDEGHVSRERKAFISNTDHELLAGISEMLSSQGIETKLAPEQHKLHIRGRKNFERFFDIVPVAADEKYYRALDGLEEYTVAGRKARLLEVTAEQPQQSDALAAEIGLSQGRTNALIREFKEQGYIQKQVEGSNRSEDGSRTVRYAAVNFQDSIYATLRGYPHAAEVTAIHERDYTGEVYDLTIDETAPNFAVEGGNVVHNSTRHHTVEKLYDRGYLEDDPPRPTALAEAVVNAAEEFAEMVVSEEMTAELEADMTAIASGEATLDEVTDSSREMLERVFEELHESREAVGDHLQESLKADRRLGPCPECGSDLLVRQSRQGSYFVGCDGFPECRFTLPLPSTGEPLVLEDTCDDHQMHHVKMLAGRDTFVHGCPRCAAAEADESEDRIIGACPECGEGVAPEEQRDGDGDSEAQSASNRSSGHSPREEAVDEGGELAIKQLRSGSRLVGCTRYPDCEYSLPLPRRGDIEVTEEYCEEHDLPELTVHDGDDPWELGCPVCNYQEYQAEQAIDSLEDISGIGEKTAQKLAEIGVESPDDLGTVDPDEIANQVQGVTVDQLEDWRQQIAG
ncbi:DNA topoisomerase I [Halovenus halobia]|uniref:DNA topoisomerase I n=1 Tax=Halovenus halobia TaxID=3396622 RepID=UPI003F57BD4B